MSVNPFIISRVDTPFQQHPDLAAIHDSAFRELTCAIAAIKQDPNTQSRGAVITGAPGTGKTHLMMRLAKEVICANRLLFIRQPNHEEAVLFHIYTQILASMVEPVPDTPYSQLAFLLGKSFAAILIRRIRERGCRTGKDREILRLLEADPLNIYKKIGAPGTDVRRRNWRYIEARTMEWWEATYGLGGYAPEILKALIRYCRYTDPARRRTAYKWLSGMEMDEAETATIGLSPHGDPHFRESFSMEAITVFGKLSLRDEPQILVFDQLEGLHYNQPLLFRFVEAVKEIFTHLPNALIVCNLLPDRWEEWQRRLDPSVLHRFSQINLHLSRISPAEKTALLTLRAEATGNHLSALFTEDEIRQITEQTSVRGMLMAASDLFRHKTEGIPLPGRAKSFAERMEEEIRHLKAEIATLKKYLHITVPHLQEAMAAEEISLFFDQKKKEMDREKTDPLFATDSDDAGKLMTLCQIFSEDGIEAIKTLRVGKKKLPANLFIQGRHHSLVVGFLHAEGIAYTSRMKNFADLAKDRPDCRFLLFRNHTAAKVVGRGGRREMDRLLSLENAEYHLLTGESRRDFDLLYELVVAAQNRDMDREPRQALRAARSLMPSHFLFGILRSAGVRLEDTGCQEGSLGR